uniref:Methionyl/Valyl/Leucyl/Isoleucyl-tRNA synthetase anticodon-binding domain-containing protein n=1 Tax=Ditylenchus dipsaci TaxID=166011 RepID=A0A915ER32_9BILA
MSKSVGNVVSPENVTDGSDTISAIGVDGLRFWVASSCGSLDAPSISKNVLKAIEQKLYVIRRTLKYLLGVMDNMEIKEVSQRVLMVKKLRTIDRYILLRLRHDFFDFLGNPLSSLYVKRLRDRMYCYSLGSQERDAALFTFLIVGHRLVGSIAPILPHLAVEFFQHHPLYKDEIELATRLTFDDLKLNDEWIGDELHLNRTMGLVFQLRENLNIKNDRELEMKCV